MSPTPKLVLLNDGKGNFTIGGTYGDPKWSTRNAAVGDLNGDGYPDIAVANREMTSYVCLNDGKLHFDCHPLKDSPSAATVAIADMNGDGANDVIYACRDSCQSVVYFNDGKGNLTAKWPGDRRNHPPERWRLPILMVTANWTSRLARGHGLLCGTSMTAKAILPRAFDSTRPRRFPIR